MADGDTQQIQRYRRFLKAQCEGSPGGSGGKKKKRRPKKRWLNVVVTEVRRVEIYDWRSRSRWRVVVNEVTENGPKWLVVLKYITTYIIIIIKINIFFKFSITEK